MLAHGDAHRRPLGLFADDVDDQGNCPGRLIRQHRLDRLDVGDRQQFEIEQKDFVARPAIIVCNDPEISAPAAILEPVLAEMIDQPAVNLCPSSILGCLVS